MKRTLLMISLLAAGAWFCVDLAHRFAGEFAWDFAINDTAALALRLGLPLYDPPTLRNLGGASIDARLYTVFTMPYNSFIGPPTTALFLIPFSFFSYLSAITLYRLCCGVAFLGAIVIASRSMPSASRTQGVIWAVFAFFLWDGVRVSLTVGQVDAFIALGFAMSMGIASRQWRHITGIGAALAAVLKISPTILIVTLGLRKYWREVITAAVFGLVLLAILLAMGSSNQLASFATTIAPTLSQSSLHVENQSLPAYLARLVSVATDFTNYSVGIGLYRLLSLPIGMIGIALALWIAKRHADHPLYVSILILTALLMGPLTWGHYTSWASIAIMPMVDRRFWEERSMRERRNLYTLLAVGFLLIALPIYAINPAALASFPWLRLFTGVRTLGLLGWLGVGCWLGLTATPTSGGLHDANQASR